MTPYEAAQQFINVAEWSHVGNVQYAVVGRTCFIHGTNDFWDWLDNIDGYQGHTERFIAGVHLRDVDMFVGHSLGGAVAEMCAVYLNKAAISFNPPRYLTSPLERGNNGVITRCVNRGDWVPKLPFWRKRYPADLTTKVGNYLGLLAPSRKRHGMQRMRNLLPKIT